MVSLPLSPYVLGSLCGSMQYPPAARGTKGALMASVSCPPPPAQTSAWADEAEGGGGGGGESLFASSRQPVSTMAHASARAERRATEGGRSRWGRTQGRVPRPVRRSARFARG